MGWFDGTSSSSKGYFVRKRSPRRSSSHGYSTHHSSGRHSAPSLFNLGGHTNKSSSSFFSTSSSSRRARPRSGFIERIIHRIKRLLRDIYYYARRHPMKVFLLVIMPLITGGILQKLLGMVGLRLPGGLMGNLANAGQGSRGGFGGLGSSGSNGFGEGVNGLMTIAKMFA
ncbi:hypothetical protein BGW36DRAFT_361393 [Talaromyces proteolyticus]|uniref:Uncharacterized protein n=1 Tax=Talaromyces proteolyticus TaxID=1131652 RepID=A0AAD4PY04_9EURO|nr:uncharacterized protein BGW36DRAFT_361393 [Talaromyces proteolyticus]KAH8693536.1 hypothetical protein BGW36DRAFT_361393 [Talaromyces proteolyticus]